MLNWMWRANPKMVIKMPILTNIYIYEFCFEKGIMLKSGLTLYRYHVPRSWFKPTGNILVIFEEKGGDPTKIRLSKRKITGVCAHLGVGHPLIESSSEVENIRRMNKSSVHLKCPHNTRIATIKFASFGTPQGTCGSYSIGDCHDPESTSLVEKVTFLLPSLMQCFISYV